MELRVLHYFLAIAQEQSIVRAAESLHLSQPTLSTQIKNMEKELGKQLLIRGTKGSFYSDREVSCFFKKNCSIFQPVNLAGTKKPHKTAG